MTGEGGVKGPFGPCERLSFVSPRLCVQGLVVGVLAIVLSKNKRGRGLVGIAS